MNTSTSKSLLHVTVTPALPSNDQSRRGSRRRRLRAQLNVETIRHANARRRLQHVVDSAELLRELEISDSPATRHYPSVVARVARAMSEEEERIFHIGERVGILRAKMAVFQ